MIPNKESCFQTKDSLLPENWEIAYDGLRRRYFYVDHNSRTTTWLNPLDKMNKPTKISECHRDQLPYGWERIQDPSVGVYYSNHIERKNQWANPVEEWRSRIGPQHHYSNSHYISSIAQLPQNLVVNSKTDSQSTKTNTSLNASEIDCKFMTVSEHSNTRSLEMSNTMKSSHSTQGSRYEDSDLLDIMDNCFGRKSSQSVEV